jgi:carbon storage regulator CsrA
MLVLTIKIGSSIYIGDEITVTLLNTQDGYSSRLGIDAPKSINVVREELIDRDESLE